MEEGSTASGSQSKRRENIGKRDPRIDEARNHCRTLVLEWFRNHNMVFLEKQYLNNGLKGLELVKNNLLVILREVWEPTFAGKTEIRKYGFKFRILPC
jgi:hypothetical protein